MDEEKTIRKSIIITKKLSEMVDEIRKEKGYKSFVSVIELAIGELYSQVFKDYVMARNKQSAKTPEEKAEASLKIQEIKKQKEEDILLAIAAKLDGRVSGPMGDRRVKYFTYDKSNRYEQEVPLEMMSEELIDAQYYPDQPTILRRQKEGKVNYDPKSYN